MSHSSDLVALAPLLAVLLTLKGKVCLSADGNCLTMRDSTGNRSISRLQFRPLLRLSPAALVVLYLCSAGYPCDRWAGAIPGMGVPVSIVRTGRPGESCYPIGQVTHNGGARERGNATPHRRSPHSRPIRPSQAAGEEWDTATKDRGSKATYLGKLTEAQAPAAAEKGVHPARPPHRVIRWRLPVQST